MFNYIRSFHLCHLQSVTVWLTYFMTRVGFILPLNTFVHHCPLNYKLYIINSREFAHILRVSI